MAQKTNESIEEKRLVKISIWYLILNIIGRFFVFISLWFIFYVIVGGFNRESTNSGMISALIAGVIPIIFLIGDILYWKRSGIKVNSHGDHIVVLGGLNYKEDKLLNGSVIANEVHRNPLDQILGMATIRSGVLGDSPISGVNYNDIKEYDSAMRGSGPKVTSFF